MSDYSNDNKLLLATAKAVGQIEIDVADFDENSIPFKTTLERSSNFVQAGAFPVTYGTNNNRDNDNDITCDSDSDENDNNNPRHPDFVELEAELVTDNVRHVDSDIKSSPNHDVIIQATNIKAEPIFDKTTPQQRYSNRTIGLIVFAVILLGATIGIAFAAAALEYFEDKTTTSAEDEENKFPLLENVRFTKHAILFHIENNCAKVYTSTAANIGGNSNIINDKTMEDEDLTADFKIIVQCGNRNDTNQKNIISFDFSTNGTSCNRTAQDTLECRIRLQSEQMDDKNKTSEFHSKNGTIFYSCGRSYDDKNNAISAEVGSDDSPIASVVVPTSRGIGCNSGSGKSSTSLSLSRLCYEKGNSSIKTWRSVTNSTDFTTCPLGNDESKNNTSFNSSTINGIHFCQANTSCLKSNCTMNEFKSVDYWDDHSCDFPPDESSKTNQDDVITLFEEELGFL